MDKLAELNYVLDELGMAEFINIIDNREEVKQLCNKIGRPDLFNLSVEALDNKSSDGEYETETSDDDSECSVDDLVKEDLKINPCGNGFFELQDVVIVEPDSP